MAQGPLRLHGFGSGLYHRQAKLRPQQHAATQVRAARQSAAAQDYGCLSRPHPGVADSDHRLVPRNFGEPRLELTERNELGIDDLPKCLLHLLGLTHVEHVHLLKMFGDPVWLDLQQENRNKAVAIAAGREYFNQDPNIIRFVMENPTDRVTYGDLRMIRAEFEELMQLSVEAGTIKHPIPYETYVDETFARRANAARIAL